MTENLHTFNTGQTCEMSGCGAYHYTCIVCGTDCTAGTAGGPATTAIDGKRRCWRCNRKHDDLLGSATPRTEDEAKVIEKALVYYIHERGDFVDVIDNMRNIAERITKARLR